ncbi:glycosyl hydrolase family 18 protein [Catenulispora pinisilvae]|uniref:glycosyl hydrolase family 18 protein n=1 Tax=Catenulispora pinisilvae TaxID=2705253 RepID=UPI0018923ED1|nr:glycosyl hydrolase family 18 protein [Catenulispora pinisilvae]
MRNHRTAHRITRRISGLTAHRTARRTLAASAVGVLATAVLTLPTGTASAFTGLPVVGYQEEGDATSLIDAGAGALGSVGVDGVNITSDGTSVSVPDDGALNQLATAHADGLPAEFLVGNFSQAIGDFDESAAYNLLSSQDNIKNVVASLSDAVASQGWDGVTVDIESLRSRDTDGLTAFVTALKQALPSGKTVSLDLMNGQSAAEYSDLGYDLPALGQVVDHLVLMAYDQHTQDSGPGPVGALSWQQQGLDVLVSEVPAGKVDLGVAGYGYSWPPGGGATQVSDQGARDLVAADGATAQFDDASGEWTATLSDGTVLWWSDAQSLALRRTMAANAGIHGLAVWDLALSDPIQQ